MSIIGCHNCSYSAILIVFCTFKFSSMTLSLSLLHVHWILCYRIKNISFMVFIKQLKPRILCSVIVAIQTGALPSKVRVPGSNPLPGTGKKFSSFLFLLFFPSFPQHCAFTQVVCASVGRVQRVYLAGLLTIDFDHKL